MQTGVQLGAAVSGMTVIIVYTVLGVVSALIAGTFRPVAPLRMRRADRQQP